MTGDRPLQPPPHPRDGRPRGGPTGPPPPGRRPRQPGPPPGEDGQIIRRDGRPAGPHQRPPGPSQQAWSQAAPPRYTQRPSAPGHQPPPHRPPPGERPYQRGPQNYRHPHEPSPRRRPLPHAPTAPPAARAPRRSRWGRRLAILATVFAVLLTGFVVYLDRALNRVDAIADYPGRVADTPGINWLLVGSDSRSGMTPEEEALLATGGDTGPQRTDTIIMIHIPSGGGAATMVSLPRDSYVSVPGYGQNKLNAAFAFGGPQLLVHTVEEATGVHIDHYAEIGFGGFAGMVDAVGGVEMCVDQPIDDPLAGINLPAGCQVLDGPQALGFVRTRATAMADIDRMNNQRAFMSALLAKSTSATTLLNPFRSVPLALGTVGSLKVGQSEHIWHLARLGWAMRGNVIATTVPIGGFADTPAGNAVMWDREPALQFFDYIATSRPLPPELITTGP